MPFHVFIQTWSEFKADTIIYYLYYPHTYVYTYVQYRSRVDTHGNTQYFAC